MLVRKAKKEEYPIIANYIFLAMEEIMYHFIGETHKEKAVQLLGSLIQEPNNQYSYENCWIAVDDKEIVAAALVYDGAKLNELRAPVAHKITTMFNSNFNPEDETEAGEYYIDCVGVNPDKQGRGIGSIMLKFLIDEYVHKQKETLGLLVDKENPNAQRLYLKLGFEIVGDKFFAGKKLNHLQFKPSK